MTTSFSITATTQLDNGGSSPSGKRADTTLHLMIGCHRILLRDATLIDDLHLLLFGLETRLWLDRDVG